MLILVLNSGSSSVKYQLYAMPKEACLAKGIIERIGRRSALLKHYPAAQTALKLKAKVRHHRAALKLIIESLRHPRYGVIASVDKIDAIGHRVVQGGEKFKASTLINPEVVRAIKRYSKLAPLHNPPNLSGIYACRQILPRQMQVAVFDTAFHQRMPARAYLYGLPLAIYKKEGIRRYGFHGSSHRYVSEQASKILRRPLKSLKIITCHLGNGCSIAAIERGRAIDTSMGFTPLEGLVMGTRCGDIDPAAVLYLMKKRKMSVSRTDKLLNRASGLLGLSQKSNDMRIILKAAGRGDKKANTALEVFVYRVVKYIGAYVAAMNGCDAIIFTAGIGENAPEIRHRVCRQLSALIKKFKIKVLVIPTNEELMIARDTYKLVCSLPIYRQNK